MPFFHKFVAILSGSLLISMGINFFLVPYELLDGGIIGLGLIVKYLTGIKAGLAIIVMSIPVFILAWIRNKNYFINSLHGMLISSFAIDVLFPLHNSLISKIHLTAVVSSMIGGLLVGFGIGVMLRYETSTGGTDLIAQFISEVIKVNVGMVIFAIDAIVICVGGLLISKETFLLSVVTIIFVGIATSMCTWNMEKVS